MGKEKEAQLILSRLSLLEKCDGWDFSIKLCLLKGKIDEAMLVLAKIPFMNRKVNILSESIKALVKDQKIELVHSLLSTINLKDKFLSEQMVLALDFSKIRFLELQEKFLLLEENVEILSPLDLLKILNSSLIPDEKAELVKYKIAQLGTETRSKIYQNVCTLFYFSVSDTERDALDKDHDFGCNACYTDSEKANSFPRLISAIEMFLIRRK